MRVKLNSTLSTLFLYSINERIITLRFDIFASVSDKIFCKLVSHVPLYAAILTISTLAPCNLVLSPRQYWGWVKLNTVQWGPMGRVLNPIAKLNAKFKWLNVFFLNVSLFVI